MNIEYLEKEILNICQSLVENFCFGCLYNSPSQKDHNCITGLNHNWALEEAIELVKTKYSIEESLDYLIEKHKI